MPKDKDKDKKLENEEIQEEVTSVDAVESELIAPEADESPEIPEELASEKSMDLDVNTLAEEPVVSEDINADVSVEVEAGTGAGDTVTVQPVQFASFEELNPAQGEANKNLDILMDIKLQMTVELGRTELPIKKVLELTRGSIIELEKVAGEPVELYANGKLVAHGEVVVIEDNFGLRITSITEPQERLRGL